MDSLIDYLKNKKWSVQNSYTCKQTVRIDSAICVHVFEHINMYVCMYIKIIFNIRMEGHEELKERYPRYPRGAGRIKRSGEKFIIPL